MATGKKKDDKQTNNIQIIVNTQDEEKKTEDVPALAGKADLVISNQEQYENANVILKEIKTRWKELDEERKSITKPMDDAKKRIMDLFKKPLDLLESAENKIKKLMIGYTQEQERIAREEQERLQKEADKIAEEERKKLEAKKARAEASGKTEKAEELAMQIETIIPAQAPVVTANIGKVSGVSYKDKWSAEVVDFNLLPNEYKIANQQALDKVAQATKGGITIPGVKFKSEKILASRL